MRIGDTYLCERVTEADVEKLAADTGLSRPLVHRCLPELAEAIVTKSKEIQNDAPTAQALAEQIRARCQHMLELW